MTRYLAFGEDMLKVRPYYSSKTPRKLLTSVELWLSRQDRHAVLLPTEACSLFIVIGLADEEWWVVWDPFSNRFGRINDQALWDGNG